MKSQKTHSKFTQQIYSVYNERTVADIHQLLFDRLKEGKGLTQDELEIVIDFTQSMHRVQPTITFNEARS